MNDNKPSTYIKSGHNTVDAKGCQYWDEGWCYHRKAPESTPCCGLSNCKLDRGGDNECSGQA